MKDKASSAQGPLPCPSGAACLLWLDYLDLADSPREEPLADLTSAELQTVQKLEQHLFDCPLCTQLMHSERKRHMRQRAVLQSLLREGEQLVPSTTGQILSALKREKDLAAFSDGAEIEVGVMRPVMQKSQERKRPAGRSRHLVRTTFALVAAIAIVLAGISVFQQITVMPRPSSSAVKSFVKKPLPTPVRTLTSSWGSLVVTRPSVDGKNLLIENYDPFSKRSVLLLPGCCTLDTVVDGVSHAGDDLLYHRFAQGQTTYSLLSGQSFVVRGQGSNAIWSTDDHFIYIFVDQHLLQYDVRLHTQKTLAFALPVSVSRLQFYYRQYLYFSLARTTMSTDLYRINLTTGSVQWLTESLPLTTEPITFWLSPAGTTIYYVNAIGGEDGIFSINLDGTNQGMVVANAFPVGYASDNTLVVLREVEGKFQLVKLSTPQQVLVSDLAPGAVKLSASDVALAPYAGVVVVAGTSSDDLLQLWATNLTDFTQQVFLSLTAAQQTVPVHLIGWDRLRVS